MTALRPTAIALFALLSASASAHNGAQLSRADFLHPAPYIETAYGDADTNNATNIRFSYFPEDADAHFRITWQDGDTDPTGRFSFYYLDRSLPDAVTASQIEQLGHPIIDVNGRTASVWASCFCDEDAGVTCPPIDFIDAGHRWCDNFVDWDTSQVPAGAFFIAAVNDDPPYHVYNLSATPVRVSHQSSRGPIVIVVRPSGAGLADAAYRIALLIDGSPPLTVDLAFAPDDAAHVLGPLQTIALALPATLSADGAAHADWDTHALSAGNYFVRATLHDAAGRSAESDSRGGLSILHLGDAGASRDLQASMIQDLGSSTPLTSPMTPGGCACRLHPTPSRLPPLAILALLPLLLALFSRRCRRRSA